MGEARTRKEMSMADQVKYNAFSAKMKASLSDMSQNDAGLQVLRYILHESCFLAPLTYETAEGMNTDILLQREAKRMMYLSLRVHMDTETINRIEHNTTPKQEEQNGS